MSKNTQLGIRLPNDLYALLERERLSALEAGEKVTMTELVVKYLRVGMGYSTSIDNQKEEISLRPTLERLALVLERVEQKL
jgi:hypothetical protein